MHKHPVLFLVIFIAVLTVIPRRATALEINGFLAESLNMKFQDDQKFIKEVTSLRLNLRDQVESAAFFTDINLHYDPLYNSAPAGVIREAYIKLSLGPLDFQLGRQITIWGKADEFNPTDFISPEDYREFILPGKADRKIGIFYPKIDYYFGNGNFRIQGIFIPTFTPSEIPMDTTSPWIPYQIKEILTNPGITLNDPLMPGYKLKNSEYAFRFEGMMSAFDFSVSYFDGFFDLPVMFLSINPEDMTITINPEYKRFRAGGFDFDTNFGGLGLRGELAYVYKRYYATTDMKDTDGIVEKPDISFVLGADYTLFENLYLNLQWAGKYIFDYEKGIEEDEMENRLVFSCYDTFFDEELKFGLTGMIYRLKDMDYMIKPYIEYSAADGVSIETGAYLFGGKEQSMFGEFSGNSSVFLKISYYF